MRLQSEILFLDLGFSLHVLSYRTLEHDAWEGRVWWTLFRDSCLEVFNTEREKSCLEVFNTVRERERGTQFGRRHASWLIVNDLTRAKITRKLISNADILPSLIEYSLTWFCPLYFLLIQVHSYFSASIRLPLQCQLCSAWPAEHIFPRGRIVF